MFPSLVRRSLLEDENFNREEMLRFGSSLNMYLRRILSCIAPTVTIAHAIAHQREDCIFSNNDRM